MGTERASVVFSALPVPAAYAIVNAAAMLMMNIAMSSQNMSRLVIAM